MNQKRPIPKPCERYRHYATGAIYEIVAVIHDFPSDQIEGFEVTGLPIPGRFVTITPIKKGESIVAYTRSGAGWIRTLNNFLGVATTRKNGAITTDYRFELAEQASHPP